MHRNSSYGKSCTRGVLRSFEQLEPRQLLSATQVGAVDPGALNRWYFNSDLDTDVEMDVDFGIDGDQLVTGNWNLDQPEIDYPGVARNHPSGGLWWFLDTDGDPDDEQRFFFGLVGDVIVSADFNGDGVVDIGAVRPNGPFDPIIQKNTLTWYVAHGPFPERNGDQPGPTLAVDQQFVFGFEGDVPVPGNWDGVGGAEVGVVSSVPVNGLSRWYILGTSGIATIDYGFPGQTPVVGDWDGDGTDNLGMVHKDANDLLFWLLDTDSNFGVRDEFAEISLRFGRRSQQHIPVVGRWGFPEVSLHLGVTEIFDGQPNAVSFGNSAHGRLGEGRSFTVFNSGTTNLVTSNLTVPSGFRVTDPLARTIRPGQSDSFAVRINTDTLGVRSGDIMFLTNDGNELEYDFPITGNVLDSQPPVASVDATNVTENGKPFHDFSITYTDNLSVDVSSIDDDDVRVVGPHGFSQPAILIGIDSSSNGSPRVATYRIEANGYWDYSRNGQYTIQIHGQQVRDSSGNSIAAGSIGAFQFALPEPSGGTPTLAGVVEPRGLNRWYLNTDLDPTAEIDVDYGFQSDQLVTGKWNPNLPESDFPGVARDHFESGGLWWFLDTDGDPDDEQRFFFGLIGDIVVTADFNGDGVTDIGAVRADGPFDSVIQKNTLTWYVAHGPFPVRNGDQPGPTLAVNQQFVFGFEGDTPVPGDWDGNGAAEVGIVSSESINGLTRWYLLGPTGIKTLDYGFPSQTPIVGDWDGNGTDNVGMVHKDQGDLLNWLLDTDSNFGVRDEFAELDFRFGRKSLNHKPVVGNWAFPEVSIWNGDVELHTEGSIHFGNPLVGAVNVRELRVTNTGSVDLVLTDASVEGVGFSVTSTLPPVLAVGASTNLTLEFTGAIANSQSVGLLTLLTNDPNDSLLRLTLLGGDSDGIDESGFTGGAFDVGASGAATYSIPIAVSPGTNGIEPQLAISYSSQSGNGLLGKGFSLSGLSSISRCAATQGQDGIIDPVDLDNNDRFCVDGQRLSVVHGQYGVAGSEYRTENNNFSKVVANGNQAGSPESFTVWTKSGLILEYGSTPDSRFEAQGRNEVLNWSIHKLTDRHGNYWKASYYEDNAIGEFYPLRIEYTGNSTAGLQPYSSVSFGYENRHDSFHGFVAGSQVASTKRLNSIVSRYGEQVVREYKLQYDASALPDVSRITSITECGSDGICFPPVEFGWNGDAGSFDLHTFVTPNGYRPSNEDEDFLKGDFNGDGRTDLVEMTGSHAKVWLADSVNSFHVSEFLPWAGYAIGQAKNYRSGDINGDGLVDIVHFVGGIMNTWLSRGDGTFTVVGTTLSESFGDARNVLIGDFNGDGRSDFIHFDRTQANMLTSNGNGTYQASNATPWQGYDVGDISRYKNADINGDGRTDLLHFYGTILISWISNGDGTFALSNFTPGSNIDNGHRFKVASINSDSKSDLFFFRDSTIEIWSSRGDGTFAIQSHRPAEGLPFGNGSRLKVADFNGDGRSDIVRFYPDRVELFEFRSDNSFVESDVALWNGYAVGDEDNFSLGDWNGDGHPDVLHLVGGGVTHPWLSNHETPSRITKISVANGFEIDIEYATLADGNAVYQKGTGAQYPIVDVQRASYVVGAVHTSDGIGGTRSLAYRYGDMKFDIFRKRSLGFGWQEVVDNQLGFKTRTEFVTDVRCGCREVTRTEIRLLDGSLLSEIDNTVSVREFGDQTYFSYVEKRRSKQFELDGQLVSSTEVVSTFDDFGNRTRVTSDLSGIVSTETTATFESTESDWTIGLLTHSETVHRSGDEPAIRRTASFDYKAGTREVVKTVAQPGSPLAVETINEFDHFGNVIGATSRGEDRSCEPDCTESRSASLIFDDKGRFTTSVINSLGHVSTLVNEPLLGQVIQETNSNSLSTIFNYDGFGRLRFVDYPNEATTSLGYAACGIGECPPNAVRYRVFATSGGTPVTTYFDMLWRPVREESTGFGGRSIFVDQEFDALGRASRSSDPYYSGDTPRWSTIEYDAMQRPIAFVAPGPRRSTVDYNGLKVVSTNPMQQTRTETYDLAGRLTSVLDNLGGTIQYRYDAMSKLTATTDAAGNVTIIGYDELDNRILLDEPNRGLTTFTPNVFGEIVLQRDAKGQTQTFTFDPLGRIVQRIDSSDAVEEVSTWQYDIGNKAIGALSKIEGPNGYEYSISYDDLGRIETASLIPQTDEGPYETVNEYDSISRLKKLIYPSGYQVDYGYSDEGFLDEVLDAAGDLLWKAEAVNARGQFDRQGLGNGLKIDQVFNEETGWLERTHTPGIQDYAVTRNLVGSITRREDRINDLAETFAYDGLERLTSSQVFEDGVAGNPITVQYNASGNISYKSDVGHYNYPGPGSDRPYAVASITNIQSQVVHEYTYDLNGNRTDKDGDTTVFSTYDKPLRIEANSQFASFSYAPDRSRVKQWATSMSADVPRIFDVPLNGAGDFNGNGEFDLTDINGLTAAAADGAYDAVYDLDTDQDVDTADVQKWLELSNVTPGDVDLDGAFTSVDLLLVLRAGQYEDLQEGNSLWQTGDWNGDGEFNSSDFLLAFQTGRFGVTVGEGNAVTAGEKTYVDGIYEVELIDGTITETHFIVGGGGTVAIHEIVDGEQTTTKYLHKDHLGSVVAISDEEGDLLETLSFDAWGKRRDATTWKSADEVASSFDRGFTGHEMLDEVDSVHMNGRVYDPQVGRFLSPDPLLQDSLHSGNYDRYSYGFNNPLSGIDPSGYGWFSDAWDDVRDTASDVGGFIQDEIVDPIKEAGDAIADAAESIGDAVEDGVEDAVDALGDAVEEVGDFVEDYYPIIAGVAIGVITAGAGSAVGAAVATALGGAAATGAAIGAGAGFGFGAGFGTTYAAGGDLGDALEAGVTGAIVGGATAGFAGAVGGALGTAPAQVLSGGLSGLVQTGDVEGAIRGLVAGLVPNDLLLPGLFNSNVIGNVVGQAAYAAVTGAIINGSQGVISQLVGGAINNGVGHSLGLYYSGFNGPTLQHGGWVYDANLPYGPGLTIGSAVMVTDPTNLQLVGHEFAHYSQQGIMGAAYLPLQIPAALAGQVFGHSYALMDEAPFMPTSFTYTTMFSGGCC